MINILEIRPNPKSKSNGIDRYCKALRNMFLGDEGINILPVENYPMIKGRVLKERFAKGVLRKLFDNDEIDVVHINGFASFSVIQSFWYAHKAKKKIVYTAHWHPFEYLNHPFRTKIFFYLVLKLLVKRYADVVVTINKEDTAFFSMFHKKVIQIPHWIDTASLKPIQAEKTPNMVLFVGRFNDSNKGSEHLFHLPEGKYDIHCVGPCNGYLRSDMTSHVNIPFEELCSLYAKASLLVVPSRYEAFSYVALEALSYGTPVLLSDRVRIADYLDDIDGVTVYKYSDYNDFVEKVSKTIGNRIDISTINQIFSVEKQKKLYKDVFKQLRNDINNI